MKTHIDLTGQRFGLYMARTFIGAGKWECACDCGEIKAVLASNLRKGNSTSCGCARRATCSTRMTKINQTHGLARTKVYYTWEGMVARTTNPNCPKFSEYGAVGIGLADEWLDFERFFEHVGHPPTKAHSIDRIDNAKGYAPGNVRWATASEQARNRRSNRYLMVGDERLCFTEAAERMGISRSALSKRVKCGDLTACA